MLYVLVILLLTGDVVIIEGDGGEADCRELGEIAIDGGAAAYRCFELFDV